MIRPDQIPDEVVEPVARALCIAEGCDPERLRMKSSSKLWTAWADEARAAIAAALNSWPGASTATTFAPDKKTGEWSHPINVLALPLPQKDGDA